MKYCLNDSVVPVHLLIPGVKRVLITPTNLLIFKIHEMLEFSIFPFFYSTTLWYCLEILTLMAVLSVGVCIGFFHSNEDTLNKLECVRLHNFMAASPVNLCISILYHSLSIISINSQTTTRLRQILLFNCNCKMITESNMKLIKALKRSSQCIFFFDYVPSIKLSPIG